MQHADEILIRDECRQVLCDYAIAVDTADAARLVSLFCQDGVLMRGDVVLNGHAELARILDGRAPDAVMRHLLTTVSIRVAPDGRSAEATSYYLLYTGNGNERPLPLDSPFSLGDWYSRFVPTPAGWKLAHQEVRRVFMRAPQPDGARPEPRNRSAQ
jgi:ketosteroid isomerase-like protein